MHALLRIACSVAAALWCGCATNGGATAHRVAPGERVEVEYSDGVAVLALRNASSQTAVEAYSTEGKPQLKIASDESIAKLIERWTELRFFEVASATPWPNATATLKLSIDGKPHVRSRLPLEMSSIQDLQEFNDCLEMLRAIYDNTPSFHSSSATEAGDLARQNERIRQNVQQALERARVKQ